MLPDPRVLFVENSLLYCATLYYAIYFAILYFQNSNTFVSVECSTAGVETAWGPESLRILARESVC